MKCIDTLSFVISNLCKFKPHPAVEKVCTVRACACVCVCVCVCVCGAWKLCPLCLLNGSITGGTLCISMYVRCSLCV